jgi:hypothetical protein
VQFVHQVLVKPMQLTLLPDDGHVNPLQARAFGRDEVHADQAYHQGSIRLKRM